MIVKNAAYTLPFYMGTTGLTVTAVISKDGAAFASPVGAVSEIANGWYKIALTAADMNADNIAIHATSPSQQPLDVLINTDLLSTLTAAIFTYVIEGTLTFEQGMRLILSMMAADATQLTTNPIFKSLSGAKTRLAANVTAGGATRTMTTVDGT